MKKYVLIVLDGAGDLARYNGLTPLQLSNLPVLDEITEKGYGKRANAGNYRLTKRGAKGVKNIKVDNKSGKVVVALTPGDANQILATTSSGKVIRTHIDSIREIARVGRGVKVMSVDEKEKVVAVALHNEDDEERNSDLNSSENNDE